MKIKLLLTVVWLSAVAHIVWAQAEMSVFSATGRAGVATTFATDYQAVGINPANLGWEDPNGSYYTLGLLETGFSFQSTALQKGAVRQTLLKFGEQEPLTVEEKKEAARQFVNEGFAYDLDIMPLGFGFYVPGIGGFALNSRMRNTGFMRLNEFGSNMLFLGYHHDDYFTIDTTEGEMQGYATERPPKRMSEVMNGTHISYASFLEHTLAYGRQITETDKFGLYAGVGIKYLQGIATADVRIEDGTVSGFSAASPAIPIDYGDLDADLDTSGALRPAGSGWGFEVGVNAIIGDNTRVGAALLDVGSINWTGNVLVLENNIIDTMDYDGIEHYNIAEQMQAVSGSGVFQWEDEETRTQRLPTRLRLGGSILLLDGKLHVGADAVIPVNDATANYQRALFAVGGDYTLLHWLRLSSGMAIGGNYTARVPLGVTFLLGDPKGYEMGVATRDATIFLGKNNPNFAFATGFLRFRF